MRDLSRYRDDYLSLGYEEDQESFRRTHVISELRRRGRQTVLEVGCGRLSVFSEAGFEYSHGVVVEPISEFVALQRGKVSVDKVEIHNLTLEDFSLKFSDVMFDTVILSSILHEIEDAKSFLATVRKHVSVGGEILVVVPNAFSLHRLLAMSQGLIPSLTAPSAVQSKMQQSGTVFSPESLQAVVEDAGFEIESCRTVVPKFFHHQKMADLLLNSPGFRDLNNSVQKFDREFEPHGSEILLVAKRV